MAKNTRQHVFDGMELLPEGLIPFVEKQIKASVIGLIALNMKYPGEGYTPSAKCVTHVFGIKCYLSHRYTP